MKQEEKGKYLYIKLATHLPYAYSAGRYLSRFLVALRDEGKILASRCSACATVLVPPRLVCGQCFAEMREFVEVGPQGTLTTFSVINFPFIDPFTGAERPVPYGYAIIQLDGCSNRFPHFLEETNLERLRIGLRVEAVFKPQSERVGAMTDIIHFRIIEA
jgi:hypothetical protein